MRAAFGHAPIAVEARGLSLKRGGQETAAETSDDRQGQTRNLASFQPIMVAMVRGCEDLRFPEKEDFAKCVVRSWLIRVFRVFPGERQHN